MITPISMTSKQGTYPRQSTLDKVPVFYVEIGVGRQNLLLTGTSMSVSTFFGLLVRDGQPFILFYIKDTCHPVVTVKTHFIINIVIKNVSRMRHGCHKIREKCM